MAGISSGGEGPVPDEVVSAVSKVRLVSCQKTMMADGWMAFMRCKFRWCSMEGADRGGVR